MRALLPNEISEGTDSASAPSTAPISELDAEQKPNTDVWD